jgi:Asp-tRNA(Asn)/Glu-tRNA(Gln) amidotransferase A subunit family amidase
MFSRRSFAAGLFAAPLAAIPASDPADLTVGEAITLVRQRKLTPLELTQACLMRIERLNPRLNAIITRTR